MKVFLQKKTKFLLMLVLCLSFMSAAFASSGAGVEPGSEQDPIAAKSYVDEKFAALAKENSSLKNLVQQQQKTIEQLLKDVDDLRNSPGSGGVSAAFEVVVLECGQTLYTGDGTEIVLRSGKAKAIKGEYGGLSDVTSAIDLEGGADISPNHLIICARDDGRGVKASLKCYFLVRGKHRIKGEPQPEPTPEPQKKTYAVVAATTLNVRAKPDTSAPILAKLRSGEKVEVLSKSQGWFQVVTPSGIKGWVSADFIRLE